MDIDLGNISDKLKQEFPEIEKIYLFGSRRYKTKSYRSDIDLLIEFNSHVKQKDILEYTREVCPALDIFKLEEGKATSFHNDSYIQYKNKNELLDQLNAVEIWNHINGRLEADINWIIEIDERASYPPTSLPNREYNNYEQGQNPAELEFGQLLELIKKLKPDQVWKLGSVIFSILVVAFYLGTLAIKLTSNNNSKSNQRDNSGYLRNQMLVKSRDSTLKEPKSKKENTQINLHSYSPRILALGNNTDSLLVSIRRQNNLRQISTFESGKTISELSKKTYFFISIFF